MEQYENGARPGDLWPPETSLESKLRNLYKDSIVDTVNEEEWRKKGADEVAKKCREILQSFGIVPERHAHVVQRLILNWDRRLWAALSMKSPKERVLCGFSSVVDLVWQLDNATWLGFVDWVEQDPGHADEPDPTKDCTSRADMLAALENAISRQKHGDEFKPRLDPGLWPGIAEYYRDHKEGGFSVRIGGAAGNMAYVLSALGVETFVHWLAHPRELADRFGELEPAFKPKRFVHDAKGWDKVPAEEAGKCAVDSGKGSKNDPCRRSYVFAFQKGRQYAYGDPKKSGLVAGTTDRVIFIVYLHRSDEHRGWASVVIRRGAEGTTSDVSLLPSTLDKNLYDGMDSHQWPSFPVFGDKHIEDGKLVVELASRNRMEKLAQEIDYFMLSGIQSIPFLPDEAKEAIQEALIEQLDVLTENGVIIHWEIGGVKYPAIRNCLANIVRGRVTSAALNPEELKTITDHRDFPGGGYQGNGRDDDDIFVRYRRAVDLARELHLDQLYVHGNDVDLIVRRNATRGALRQEVDATLFAKCAVLVVLARRSEAGSVSSPRGGSVMPVELTTSGFNRLLDLAAKLATEQFPNHRELRERLFQNIAWTGYYFERDPNRYSVIVVPVMWPEQFVKQHEFDTAGAGDTTSTVVAVFSGQ